MIPFLIIGCISNHSTKNFSRRVEYVNQHPNNKFNNQILNSVIDIGMTKEMVIASWNNPLSILQTPKSKYWDEQWRYFGYPNIRYLYFYNDIFVYITDHDNPKIKD